MIGVSWTGLKKVVDPRLDGFYSGDCAREEGRREVRMRGG